MDTSSASGVDVVVVGSGFGGAVHAARLAEAGMRVLVLERGPWWGAGGRERPPDEARPYPRGALGSRKLLRGLRWARRGRRVELVANRDGFLELHRFDRLTAVTSSGVGGGSHHYTGIMEEPAPDFFDAYPPEITADGLRPGFDAVRQMLRPAPVPQRPGKDDVFDAAVTAAGLPPAEPCDLAVAWGEDPHRPRQVTNAAGVQQSTSTYRGTAFVGAADGSTTSLDLTYLPVALRNGAELRPLCEVTGVARDGRGYGVRYLDHRTGRVSTVVAPRLVLAAGCLNTLRLLFAARDAERTLPQLPASLGRHFSVNGDRLWLVWRSGVLADSSWGPSFSTVARVAREDRPDYRLGAVGIPVDALPLPRPLAARLRRSTFLFAMGRDASDGTVGFDGRGVTTTLDRTADGDLFDDLDGTMRQVARYYRARRLLPGRLPGRDELFAVHAMGGCAVGSTPAEGVVDHRGEVFGHPGLYVADGSLFPRAPGVAPSMTIAALAERQVALIAA